MRYLETWIADCVGTTRELLANKPAWLTGEQKAELQAELDLYVAAQNFLRTGEARVRVATSLPPPNVIQMVRESIQHSRDRTVDAIRETEAQNLTRQADGFKDDLKEIDSLLGYLAEYWANLPGATEPPAVNSS
jgi:hypothetical protein